MLPAGSAIIRDLAEAMTLENDQDPPPGYRIWHDVVEQTLAEFWSTPEAREGRNLVDAAADEQWNAMEDFERELRKKRICKTITAKEEFWLTVAYDSLEILKGIAVGRYVCGGVPLLEGIFSVYKGLCCTNRVRDSSRESRVVAGMHEQTHTPDLQDQELASLQ
ncbi:MAG: hypothetical protein Q4615_00970 [Paracoccus aminovorans]|nr:hypothetical protein [Paracoccus aminovorans]